MATPYVDADDCSAAIASKIAARIVIVTIFLPALYVLCGVTGWGRCVNSRCRRDSLAPHRED